MPRLPDATSLGGRPTPQPQRGVVAPRPYTGDPGYGRLAAHLGERLQQFGNRLIAERDESEKAAALNDLLVDLPAQLDQALETAKTTAQPGARDFAAGFETQAGGVVDRFMGGLRAKHSLGQRDWDELNQRARLLATAHRRDAIAFEHGERQRQKLADLGRHTELLQIEVQRDPSRFETAVARNKALWNNARSFIAPGAWGPAHAKATRELSLNYIRGLIGRDPAGAEEGLRAGEFDGLVSADGGLVAEDIDSLAEEARIATDRLNTGTAARLKGQVKDAITVLERGYFPPGLDELRQELNLTPRLADVGEALEAAVEDRDTMARFRALPLDEQRATMDELASTGVLSLRGVELLGTMERRHAGDVKAVEAALAAERAALKPVVDDVLKVVGEGYRHPDIDAVLAYAEGRPELADIAEQVTAAVKDAGELASFERAPFTVQRLHAAQIAGQGALTGRDVDRLARMQRSHTAAVQAVESDPLAYGQEVGLFDLTPVDFAEPETLAQRVELAARAGEHFGVRVAPLREVEVDALAAAVDGASAAQVAGLFDSLVRGLGEGGAQIVAGQLSLDRPALAVALASATDQPILASRIVEGERLLKANPDVAPTKSERLTAREEAYGELFEDAPGALAAYEDAGTALYAAMKVPSGEFGYDPDLYERALRAVAGGTIDARGSIEGGPVRVNGRRIVPPVPGMTGDEVEDALAQLSSDDLDRFGTGRPVYGEGQAFSPALFTRRWLGVEAQLVTAGPGRYRVLVPGVGYVLDHRGGDYVLDLKAAIAGRSGSGD